MFPIIGDVYIRTNGGRLTVNAPKDIVNHYGYVKELNVISVDLNTSYHENGVASFAVVKEGHFVVEKEGVVNVLYATGEYDGVKVDSDGGTIANAYATNDAIANETSGKPTQLGNVVLKKDGTVTADLIAALTADEINFDDEKVKEVVVANAFRKNADGSYIISNVTELQLFATEATTSGSTYTNATFKLANDIDLAGVAWIPISGQYFVGTLDGNGKAIVNLTIKQEGTSANGFFSSLGADGVTIKNLTFKNANVVGGKYVGILVGELKSSATIENVTIDDKSTVTAKAAAGVIGNIGNKNLNIELKNITSAATVVDDYGKAGGIVAQISSENSTITMTNCKNTGKVACTKDSGVAGGILGMYQQAKLIMTNCSNSGTLTGTTTANIIAAYQNGLCDITIDTYNTGDFGYLTTIWDTENNKKVEKVSSVYKFVINNKIYLYQGLGNDKNTVLFDSIYPSNNTLSKEMLDRAINFANWGYNYKEDYASVFARAGKGETCWGAANNEGWNFERTDRPDDIEKPTLDDYQITWERGKLYIVE